MILKGHKFMNVASLCEFHFTDVALKSCPRAASPVMG